MLRARLLGDLGLDQAVYMDPDTDVVADLQGIQSIAPDADMLWVANPLLLKPVLADLMKHGFHPAETSAAPVLMECGFIYMRRDFMTDFAEAALRFPDVNDFAPGSTYWNMVMLSLGAKACRLPDMFNRTFWDVPAAICDAKTVHFTGQWKHLQPHVEYDRPSHRILLRPDKFIATHEAASRSVEALAVVAIFPNDAASVPQTLSRFEAWENAGIPMRYHIAVGSETPATDPFLKDFMQGRRGRFACQDLTAFSSRIEDSLTHDDVHMRAGIRNRLLDEALAERTAHEHEWMLLLDGDIIFCQDLIERIFAARARDSRPSSIAMLTCFTQQLIREAPSPEARVECPEMPGWSTTGHYSDTFAFRDTAHRSRHPYCSFTRCSRCHQQAIAHRDSPSVPTDMPIVDVATAFGGLALVPTSVLRDRRIRWSTYDTSTDRDRGFSEHVIFCDRLRTITGKRIVILQDVDGVYRL